MFQLINQILLQFINCFKREATWRWFVVLVLGFMIRSKHRGITSTISDMRLKPEIYHCALNYFRSDAYEVNDLYEKWIEIVKERDDVLRISGRVVMLGDHIKISKEGRRMPDIQILHQESENAGKGEFIAGHTFAQISAVITNGKTSRSLPLITEPQKSPPKIPGTNKPNGDTLVVQMLNLGAKAAEYAKLDEPAIIALDAYFSKSTAFDVSKKKLTAFGKSLIRIVTRAQDSYTGYLPCEPKPTPSRGRPRKYGEKIKLKDLFNDMAAFDETTLTLYGKETKVKYRCLDLLWKPLGETIRFVAVETDRGRCVLMTDDFTLTPEEIITIYCLRFKIETGFDEQKNDLGCFSYHFWTMALDKRGRRKASVSQDDEARKVIAAKKAISSFVCLGTLASGILTLIAFSHNREIWQRYPGWVKTLRSDIPSASASREALSHHFHALLHQFPNLAISNIVTPLLRHSDYLYSNFCFSNLKNTA